MVRLSHPRNTIAASRHGRPWRGARNPCGTRGFRRHHTWHPLCPDAALRMRHTPAVSIVVAALAALPGQSAAQRALKDHEFSAALPAPPRLSWRQSDIALAGAFTVALLIDAGHTRWLAQGGWRNFRESNPILGSHPTVGQLNTYTAVTGLAVLGAAAALPARVRPWLLGAALAVETFTIAGTTHQGIAIRF